MCRSNTAVCLDSEQVRRPAQPWPGPVANIGGARDIASPAISESNPQPDCALLIGGVRDAGVLRVPRSVPRWFPPVWVRPASRVRGAGRVVIGYTEMESSASREHLAARPLAEGQAGTDGHYPCHTRDRNTAVTYDQLLPGPEGSTYGSSWGASQVPLGFRHISPSHNTVPQLQGLSDWSPSLYPGGDRVHHRPPDDLLPTASSHTAQMYGTAEWDRHTWAGGNSSPFGLYTPGGTSFSTPGATFDDLVGAGSQTQRARLRERAAASLPSSHTSQAGSTSPASAARDDTRARAGSQHQRDQLARENMFKSDIVSYGRTNVEQGLGNDLPSSHTSQASSQLQIDVDGEFEPGHARARRHRAQTAQDYRFAPETMDSGP